MNLANVATFDWTVHIVPLVAPRSMPVALVLGQAGEEFGGFGQALTMRPLAAPGWTLVPSMVSMTRAALKVSYSTPGPTSPPFKVYGKVLPEVLGLKRWAPLPFLRQVRRLAKYRRVRQTDGLRGE